MKKARLTEEQIISILQEHEAGAKCADLCRKHGMSEGTFYAWKAKYSGMTVSEAKRLKALEDENAKLKRLLAEQKQRYIDELVAGRLPAPFQALVSALLYAPDKNSLEWKALEAAADGKRGRSEQPQRTHSGISARWKRISADLVAGLSPPPPAQPKPL